MRFKECSPLRGWTTHRPARWCPKFYSFYIGLVSRAKERKGEKVLQEREREGEEKRREDEEETGEKKKKTKRRNTTYVFEQ